MTPSLADSVGVNFPPDEWRLADVRPALTVPERFA